MAVAWDHLGHILTSAKRRIFLRLGYALNFWGSTHLLNLVQLLLVLELSHFSQIIGGLKCFMSTTVGSFQGAFVCIRPNLRLFGSNSRIVLSVVSLSNQSLSDIVLLGGSGSWSVPFIRVVLILLSLIASLPLIRLLSVEFISHILSAWHILIWVDQHEQSCLRVSLKFCKNALHHARPHIVELFYAILQVFMFLKFLRSH